VHQAARSALVEELGIEPAPTLQELERAILRQDPSLDLAAEQPTEHHELKLAPSLPSRSTRRGRFW